MKKGLGILIVGFLCVSFLVYAQEVGIEELEKIYGEQKVVVASAEEEPLKEAPVITTVITAEEIKRMGARTLNDVLLTIPGFSLTQDHNEYFSAERGIYASSQQKILVLRDGHRLNSRSYSEANFGPAISLANVKRIEIMRGPGASLYGDVALTGVINIVTKDGKDINGSEVTIGVGNHGLKKIDFLGGWNFGEEKDLMFFGSLFETKGEKASWVDPRSNEIGTSILYGFRDKPAYDIGFKYRTGDLVFSGSRRYEHYVEPRSGSGVTGEIYNIHDYDKFSGETPGLASTFDHLELKYTPQIEDNLWTMRVYFDDFKLGAHLIIDPSIKKHGYLQWRDWDFGGQIQMSKPYSFENWGNGSLLVGMQIEFREVYDSSFKAGNDVSGYTESANKPLMTGKEKTYALFTQVKHRFTKNLLANLGVRYDFIDRRDYEDTFQKVKDVDEVSPRAAIIYFPTDDIDLRLSYGHSFVDAPYWYRYNIFPSYQGARTLRPEELDCYQFTVTHRFSKWLTNQVNFFWNDFTNVIFRDVGGVYSNAGEVKTQGVEYEMRIKKKNISLRTNYTYQYALKSLGFEAKEGMIENVPRHIANLVVDYAPWYYFKNIKWGKDFWLHFSLRYVGKQFARWGKSLSNPDDEVDDAVICNLGFNLEKFMGKNITFRFHIYNLFDEDYYQGGSVPYPYKQPGRWYLAQISYKW